MTQAIVGKIYKIKKGSEGKCGVYVGQHRAVKIKITSIKKIDNLVYDIFDSQNNFLDECNRCFTESDLEEIEKTLNNLEIGDVVVDKAGDIRTVLSVLPSAPDNLIYVLSRCDNEKKILGIFSAHELEQAGYTIFSTPPTPKRTVDDVLAQLSEEDKEVVKNALK